MCIEPHPHPPPPVPLEAVLEPLSNLSDLKNDHISVIATSVKLVKYCRDEHQLFNQSVGSKVGRCWLHTYELPKVKFNEYLFPM